MRFLIVLAFLVSSCGSDDSNNSDAVAELSPILGGWYIISTEFEYESRYVFTENGEFEDYFGVLQDDNGIEAVVTTGTYEINDDVVSFTPLKSTCEEPYPISDKTFTISGDRLTLVGSKSSKLYLRDGSGGQEAYTGNISYGCFIEARFNERQLQDLE